MKTDPHIPAAVGIRAHSGWAAVVAVAPNGSSIDILDRRRINVVETKGPRANQPYHYAKMIPLAEAQEHLDRCEETAVRLAADGLADLNDKLRGARYRVIGCSILQTSTRTLPELSQILASHAMIHTAEGLFFRSVFARACDKFKLPVTKISERELVDLASRKLRISPPKITSQLTALGRNLGPPWTQDQKFAALAAWLLLPS